MAVDELAVLTEAPADAPVVLADHREVQSGIPELLEAAGIEVRLCDLPVGDYVISDELAVERKSGGDLTSSIKDGRLFDQAMRLQDAYPRAVLVIEGVPVWMPEPSWRGAVCRLVEDGVTVLQALDAQDAAAWVERLARRAHRTGTPGGRALGRRRAAPTAEAQAVAMLACVPGISARAAGRLLDHFGSVLEVAAASERELREVPGVGAIRARALKAALARDG
ncbi:ERCC4 domain-containing protein [Conexibacter sp. SYSU D00693]|uniref:ERCC4 domain-containing protein n=1 Tax=Conexibacter sp. SYSU D00693 TaxID=2812560 RepID=UPI00196A227B|nr:ERCC4 domain-containing protein [Conexibacter sp. SYSU D00693]